MSNAKTPHIASQGPIMSLTIRIGAGRPTDRPALVGLLALALVICPPRIQAGWAQPAASAHSDNEAAFLAEDDAAMTRMMTGMAPKPTGNVDRDFVAMMVPHHQGAIDMAVAELRHGTNEQLRRIAQEIIVTQQQEIAAMHLAIGEPPPNPAAAPTQAPPPAGTGATNPHTMAGHDTQAGMKMQ
jgi:hypothetical protein